MTVELFANQPATTVSSGGTDAPASGTQETWTVASSSEFPAAASGATPPTQFHVADVASSASSELITVTNISGTTWTVTRGAESTTPVAHVAGFTIYQVVTAGVLTPLGAVNAASGLLGLDSASRLLTPAGASYESSWPTAGSYLVPSPQPVTHRPVWHQATFAQLFQTGHGWTTNGTGVATSNLNDTSIFIKGTQCATVTTAGNAAQAALRVTAGPTVDMTGKALRLTFMVADVTHLNTITFYLATGGFANYFILDVTTHSATAQNIVQSGEWVSLTIPWGAVFNASGGYSLSANGVPSTTTGFTDMQFNVHDDGVGAVTYHLQGVEIIPDTVTMFPNGVVSIVFDDSFQNVYDLGRPIMDGLGFRGSLYTIAQSVGTSGCLTLAELQQLQGISGWEVAGHAYTQTAHDNGYETLTALQCDDEFRYLRAWMLSNGFPADSFAYPHGNFSATTDNVPIDQICSQYFATGRTIISETPETFAPGMPFRLRALTGAGSGSGGTPVSTIIAAGGPLDRCQLDGTWYIITLHQIVASGVSSNTQILQSDFSTLMTAISSRGIPVLTVSDVMTCGGFY